MFSGIVEFQGQIISVEMKKGGMTITVMTSYTDVTVGESIAIDGICLTVTAFENGLCYFDLSPETLTITTAKNFCFGKKVNIERAMCLGDRVGGHIITGHVDGCVQVVKRKSEGEYVYFAFSMLTNETRDLLLPKGSVTINGVSLTINEITDDYFAVMLIPHTLMITNLGELREGQVVNIEFDWLLKALKGQIQQRQQWLSTTP